MAEFIKEWGPAVVAAVVFIVLIAIIQSDTVTEVVKGALVDLIQSFSETAAV
ncbi:MAG: hypothetical protein K6F00_05845 [Lachnospiraceae bacterium]|nr:hypothetical protein [Lachnospiraceae bacterium]